MAYDRWLAKHFDELVRTHPSKYIAVYRDKLVAVGNWTKKCTTRRQNKESRSRLLRCRRRGSKSRSYTLEADALGCSETHCLRPWPMSLRAKKFFGRSRIRAKFLTGL